MWYGRHCSAHFLKYGYWAALTFSCSSSWSQRQWESPKKLKRTKKRKEMKSKSPTQGFNSTHYASLLNIICVLFLLRKVKGKLRRILRRSKHNLTEKTYQENVWNSAYEFIACFFASVEWSKKKHLFLQKQIKQGNGEGGSG